jgi:predicted PurR-regulated permease PerM
MKFKIYVCVMLFIIAAATVTIAITLIYGGIKLKDSTTSAAQTATQKVNSVNQQITGVNKELQDVNIQLKKEESSLPSDSNF